MGPDVGHLLVHSATLARWTRGAGTPGGGRPERLVRVASRVPCRATGMAMGTLLPVEGGLQSDTARAVYFLPGTDVRQNDIAYLYSENGVAMGPHRVEAVEPQGDDVYLKCQARGSQPPPPNIPFDAPT